MITYVVGESIFDSKAQCLVNPVNTVGIMGKGLALEFKRHYPDMFSSYRKMCEEGALKIGQVAFWAPKNRPNHIICIFPTKVHFRNKSFIHNIEKGLQSFVKYAPIMNITSAAFPKLGCGLGGLDFENHVQPLMERILGETNLDIEIYT